MSLHLNSWHQFMFYEDFETYEMNFNQVIKTLIMNGVS